MAVAAELVDRFRADIGALTGREPGRLGLAVSGGPDSLALLLLAQAAFPDAIAAATVDHGLRPEGAAEARFVAGICVGLGVPHAILTADEAIAGNIQAGARALRYRLLGAWAAHEGLAWVATAHQQDDQAETLLMRLGRGAGLAGLAGVRARTEIHGLQLIRPLLGWSRAELARIAAPLGPVADPSNADPRYDRARLRERLAGADWLDAAAFARSAQALAQAEEALEWAAERLFAERVADGAFDPAGVPVELRRRIVLMLLGAAEPPRGPDLQRLLATLEAGGTATLAGVKCSGGARWTFTPAPPRRRG